MTYPELVLPRISFFLQCPLLWVRIPLLKVVLCQSHVLCDKNLGQLVGRLWCHKLVFNNVAAANDNGLWILYKD